MHHPTTGVRQGVVETRVLAAVGVKHTQTEPLPLSGPDSSGLYQTKGVLREVTPVVPLWPDPDDLLYKTSQHGGLEITETRVKEIAGHHLVLILPFFQTPNKIIKVGPIHCITYRYVRYTDRYSYSTEYFFTCFKNKWIMLKNRINN